METQKHIKTKVGSVIRKSGSKTVIVEVERLAQDAKFKKYIRRRKKFHVHDEGNVCRLGDQVKICETRPLSKLKSWKVLNVIKHSLFVEKGAEDTAKEKEVYDTATDTAGRS